MEEKRELRMYSLVLYQLSGIQAGIQAGHSWVEYGIKCKDKSLYNEWAHKHKTVMVMNGGGSPVLEASIDWLKNTLGVDVVTFEEPDLYNRVTACSFIVEDAVFDNNINLYDGLTSEKTKCIGQQLALRSFLNKLKFHGGH